LECFRSSFLTLLISLFSFHSCLFFFLSSLLSLFTLFLFSSLFHSLLFSSPFSSLFSSSFPLSYDLETSGPTTKGRYLHEQQFSICVGDREIVLSCESIGERSQWIQDFRRCLAAPATGTLQVCDVPKESLSHQRRGSTFIKPFTKRRDGMRRRSMVEYDLEEKSVNGGAKEGGEEEEERKILLSGTLEKKSTSRMLGGWQKRYYVHTKKYLKYYKSESVYNVGKLAAKAEAAKVEEAAMTTTTTTTGSSASETGVATASAAAVSSSAGGPLATVDLRSIVQVEHVLDVSGVTGGVFVLTLRAGERKLIQLRAKSEIEAEEWVKSLNDTSSEMTTTTNNNEVEEEMMKEDDDCGGTV